MISCSIWWILLRSMSLVVFDVAEQCVEGAAGGQIGDPAGDDDLVVERAGDRAGAPVLMLSAWRRCASSFMAIWSSVSDSAPSTSARRRSRSGVDRAHRASSSRAAR